MKIIESEDINKSSRLQDISPIDKSDIQVSEIIQDGNDKHFLKLDVAKPGKTVCVDF